ncbi:MAG: chromosome segregation protein SMC [Oscillospiraceae bacterium]
MFLKSLELHGFKSFPDRTKLEFGDGITAVVGPNGSGKSNISDAVRWVLGEQSTKTLRGAKMEDVIFGGTQSRKPQGFAEVSLTIDNSTGLLPVDSDSVTITRKYYRSTESEYLLNGTQVRLKDINELLMDTGLGRDGYSIIGQGKIAEIVGAKSGERREIFEEAAGISKFRYRKEESERRLKMAEENLLRLMDIVDELESRLGPLKAQSEKARQYLEYAEQKKEFEISYWVYQLGRLTEQLRAQDDKLTIAAGESDEIERQIEQIEQKIQDTYTLMQGCMTLSEQLRAERQELEQQSAEASSRIAVIRNDITHNCDNMERLEGEIASLLQTGENTEQEIAQRRNLTLQKQQQIAAVDAEIQTAQQQLSEAAAQTAHFTEQSEKLRQALGALSLEKAELTTHGNLSERRIDELQAVLLQNQEQLNGRESDFEKTSAALREAQKSFEENTAQMESLQNSLNGYRLKQQSRREKLETAEQALSQLDLTVKEKNQRIRLLQDLEQNLEGFSGSVKSVLHARDAGRLRGIYGSVAQLISVESRYSVAVEIALGAAMQNLVVENESAAKAAIQHLKENRAGRATFLPLTSVRGNRLNEPTLHEEDGYIALACELVTFGPEYEGIVNSLLGRIAVVEDIDAAIAIAKKYRYRFRIVTLDGQIINAGGSISGGFVARSQGILSRKNDIEKLKKEISSLLEKQTSALRHKEMLAQETARLDAEVQALQSELQTLSEELIRLNGEQKRCEHLLEEYQTQVTGLTQAVAATKQQLRQERETLNRSVLRLAELETEIQQRQKEFNELEGSNSELLARFNAVGELISSKKIERAELCKEIEALHEFIERLEARKVDSSNAIGGLKHQIEELKQKNEALAHEIIGLEQQSAQRTQEADGLGHQIAEALAQREQHEGKATKLREEQRHISERKESIIRESAHLEEQKIATQKEYDGIINQMWSEYEMTRSQADAFAKPVEDFQELQRSLSAIRMKIKNLGTVNLAAVEEYKEVKERYDSLTAQIADVERSRGELTRLIDDLTENMKELFSESFQKINHNFSQIFTDLFGGGKGELILTDPGNVLESGIEINVQPPGKVIKNLAALSGGEQAFVAIAIYFAILKVRPAPFCILDEIEAALDDVNVSKYAHYLRSYSDQTQFILITHRRGTMEEADVLYGVTMQQEGVSKLLELRVSEAEQQMGKLS